MSQPLLEAGTPPWVRPWGSVEEPVPQNWLSRQPYHGINQVVLSMEAYDRGYSRNGWLTFKQAQALGGQVRKGEHGVNIIYYSLREIEEKADEPARKVPLLKVFTVFNLEQLDGIADTQPVASHAWTPQAAAESVLRHSGATIRHQGYKAFYSTANDWIYLPQQRLFANAESYSDSATQPGIRGGDAPGGLIDRQADVSGRVGRLYQQQDSFARLWGRETENVAPT